MPATAAGRRLGRKVSAHLLLVPFLIFALFPFYHMTLTSLKQDKELYDRTAVPLLIRQGPTLTHGGPINSTHLFATYSRMLVIDVGRLGEGAAVSLYLFPLLVFVVWAQLRFVRKQAY